MASSRLSVPLEAGHQTRDGIAPAQVDPRQGDDEADQDDREQTRDRPLEGPEAPALQAQQAERDDPGDDPAGEQRDLEEQVERDRPADDLGEVGGDGHQLGLHPHAAGHRPGGSGRGTAPAGSGRWPGPAWPTASGSALPSGWHHDDPHQQVAERAPAEKLVAKLPGSTYAMAATNAGPSRINRCRTPPRMRISAAVGWARGASSTAVMRARILRRSGKVPAAARYNRARFTAFAGWRRWTRCQ